MRLIVNGYDFTPFIKSLQDSSNDVDGPNAGRNITGTMIRDRLCTKKKLTVGIIPVTAATLNAMKSALSPAEFTVLYQDDSGVSSAYQMYTNNLSWEYLFRSPSGIEYYQNFSFPLVEM